MSASEVRTQRGRERRYVGSGMGLEEADCQIGVQKRRRTDVTDLYYILPQPEYEAFLEVDQTFPSQS